VARKFSEYVLIAKNKIRLTMDEAMALRCFSSFSTDQMLGLSAFFRYVKGIEIIPAQFKKRAAAYENNTDIKYKTEIIHLAINKHGHEKPCAFLHSITPEYQAEDLLDGTMTAGLFEQSIEYSSNSDALDYIFGADKGGSDISMGFRLANRKKGNAQNCVQILAQVEDAQETHDNLIRSMFDPTIDSTGFYQSLLDDSFHCFSLQAHKVQEDGTTLCTGSDSHFVSLFEWDRHGEMMPRVLMDFQPLDSLTVEDVTDSDGKKIGEEINLPVCVRKPRSLESRTPASMIAGERRILGRREGLLSRRNKRYLREAYDAVKDANEVEEFEASDSEEEGNAPVVVGNSVTIPLITEGALPVRRSNRIQEQASKSTEEEATTATIDEQSKDSSDEDHMNDTSIVVLDEDGENVFFDADEGESDEGEDLAPTRLAFPTTNSPPGQFAEPKSNGSINGYYRLIMSNVDEKLCLGYVVLDKDQKPSGSLRSPKRKPTKKRRKKPASQMYVCSCRVCTIDLHSYRPDLATPEGSNFLKNSFE
jgi:hypothetical protein